MTQAVTYVEIDVDFCSLTYGSSPCTASVPTTGEIKCFNCFKTCQDTANFDAETLTLRHAVAADFLNKSIECLPDIVSVDYSPALLDPGKSMGQRASITVSFADHPHSDTLPGLYDKYLADRTYDPWSQGTYWAAFRSRQPYLRGAALRLIQGTADQALVDMETRNFVIDSFSGPGPDGTFTITAKDVLKLADGDRAVAPAASTGSLVSSITDSATSATLTPTGIGNEEYPASGKLNIGGKELVSFSRSGDVLDLTGGRAQNKTVAVEHDAGSRCQIVLEYSAQDPANIIADLLENYASVDSSYIPVNDWLDETEAFYRRVNTAVITEPTAVNDLVNELIEQCGLMVWWDDIDNEIKLQVLRAISTTARTFDDTNIWSASLKVEEQPSKRISRVLTYFAQFNPLIGVEDPENFRSSYFTIDTDIEVADGITQKTILSRWTPLGGQTAAGRVNDILRGRFRDPPRRISFRVGRFNGQDAPVLGEGCQIGGLPLQDATGARELVPAQIVRVKPTAAYFDVVAEEMRFTSFDTEDDENRHIIIDNDSSDLNLRTLHDALFTAPVGGESVELTVNEGVVVKSTDTSGYALEIGDWPELDTTGDRDGSTVITNIADDTGDLLPGMFVSGDGIAAGTKIDSVDSSSQVTLDTAATGTATGGALTFSLVILTVNINGTLTGKGGKGAKGRGGDDHPGYDGDDGGDALYTRYPFNLNSSAVGSIQSGGGGGGGGSGDYLGFFGPQANGGGGGGGSGYGEAGSGASGAEDGEAGTVDEGGARGNGNRGANGYSRGGNGGNRGSSGQNGNGPPGVPGGDGGDPGDAVDGWSYILEGTFSGSYYGAKVN